VLHGGGWFTSYPGRFSPGEETPCPLCRGFAEPRGRSGLVLNVLPPPGFDPLTVQPVAGRCTNYATPSSSILCNFQYLDSLMCRFHLLLITATSDFFPRRRPLPLWTWSVCFAKALNAYAGVEVHPKVMWTTRKTYTRHHTPLFRYVYLPTFRTNLLTAYKTLHPKRRYFNFDEVYWSKRCIRF
jgi:hypothetical protein